MGTFPLRKFDECLCLRADLRQAIETKPLSITAAQQCHSFNNTSCLSLFKEMFGISSEQVAL
jgi:hypothetical protein